MSYRLGIDLGTARTVGVLAGADNRIRPLLFEGSPFLPSAVCATADGGLVVGYDAIANAPVWPERFESAPKRRVFDRSVLLGKFEYPVPALVGALLHRMARRAVAAAGGPPDEIVCTYPASWGEARRGVLVEAARMAGLGEVRLVDEPSAAAAAIFTAAGAAIPPGACVIVYDLGAGTFEVSAVQRTETGYTVLATEGLTNVGGLDIDAAIVEHLGTRCEGGNRSAWDRLQNPRTAADIRNRLRLLADVQVAKETLSHTSQVNLHVPLVEVDVVLGRGDVDELSRPILERTVAAADLLVHGLDLDSTPFGGVFLVGGGSRMPLVAELLQRALGVAPTMVSEPELVVARGSLLHVVATPDRSQRRASSGRAAGAPAGRAAGAPAGGAADARADLADATTDAFGAVLLGGVPGGEPVDASAAMADPDLVASATDAGGFGDDAGVAAASPAVADRRGDRGTGSVRDAVARSVAASGQQICDPRGWVRPAAAAPSEPQPPESKSPDHGGVSGSGQRPPVPGRTGRRRGASVAVAVVAAVFLVVLGGGVALVATGLGWRWQGHPPGSAIGIPRLPGGPGTPGSGGTANPSGSTGSGSHQDQSSTGLDSTSKGASTARSRSTAPGTQASGPAPTASSTVQCVTTGQVKVAVPNVPDTICVTLAVSVLITETTGSPSPSDDALVRCKFYGTDSAALCLMYAAGTTTLESTGQVPWSMKIIIKA